MCQELIAGQHGQPQPNVSPVGMNELCQTIDGALRTKAQTEFIPATSNRLMWYQRDCQKRIGMRNPHRRTTLFVTWRRDLNAKSCRSRERRAIHDATRACDIDL